MKKWIFSSLIISSLFFTNCANVNVAQKGTDKSEQTNTKVVVPIREYSVQSVMWQQNAGEYKALCYQAFNLAKMKLDQFLEELGEQEKPPAIITDIDETVLDNSPYNAKLIEKNVEFTPDEWYAWTKLGIAEPIPGATDFLNYAASKGVEIFYITNRHISEEEATLKNMKEVNLPYVDQEHLLLMNETSSKEARFDKVRTNYNVLLYLGDNLSDFTADFRAPSTEKRNHLVEELKSEFGERFIVLPNPMYGDWEMKGIYRGKYDWSDEQKHEIRKGSLRPYRD